MAKLTFTINGTRKTVEAAAGARLIDVLRDGLGLTGTKPGCREGACGSCTVLVDGRAVRSCITPAVSVAGKRVTTIEGLATAGKLHPLQQAFLDYEAYQCGYCTPGMIVGAAGLIARDAVPGEQAVRQALDGHLCRCGSQPRIVQAVRAAAEVMRRG
jgi:aerobic-type carbon monoxide dehydrogenase small subunit (CoxS/CutS family)